MEGNAVSSSARMPGRTASWRFLLGFVALLATVIPGGAALAQEDGSQPTPYVLLLLDSQEKMNQVPGTDLLPDCAHVPPQKSAWIMTIEALAGTLESYACTSVTRQPLWGHFHRVAFTSINAPKTFEGDGLLSQFGDSVRFGMMLADTNISSGFEYWQGGCSYAEAVRNPVNDPLQPPMINLGARGPLQEDYCPLVNYDYYGEPTDQEHNFALLQYLRATAPQEPPPFNARELYPWWHGSLAAFLQDARYFYSHDPSVVPGVLGVGDPQANCRTKVIFLVTAGLTAAHLHQPPFDEHRDYDPALYDGLFNDQEGATSVYGRADDQARQLLHDGIRTFVFYFHDPAQEDPVTLERMNKIAEAGGTDEARLVTSALDLRNQMAAVISEMKAGTWSQTFTSTAFQTYDPRISMIQTAAAYTIPETGRWHGHVEFATYLCRQDQPFEVHDFGTILDGEDAAYPQQPQRVIVTPVANVLKPIAFSPEDPESGLTLEDLGLQNEDQLTAADKATALIGFMKGESNDYYAREHKLGAVVNSTPQTVGPPSLELPFASYQSQLSNGKLGFKLRYMERPTMAYVGTTEGLLHAFALAAPAATRASVGTEVFGYVPRALHASLRWLDNLQLPFVAAVDGTPIVRDVRLHARQDLLPENEQWITALIGGARQGGRFYYALNVSDPLGLAANPAGNTDGVEYFLWEMAANDPQADATVKERLGYSYARAAIGSVLLEEAGTYDEVAVAFIPGGQPVPEVADSGKAFWVVDIDPAGSLVKGRPSIRRTFLPGNAACGTPPAPGCVDPMPDPIVGTPVAHGALPGQLTTRVFVTDRGGRLWRIDTQAHNPASWTMTVFYDPYQGEEQSSRRPAYFEPSLSLRTTGELVVIYGTGDPDNPNDMNGNHKLISLTEKHSVGVAGTPIVDYGDRPNFVLDFQAREQLSAAPVVYDSTVFFATYVHNQNDACAFGETRLWGLDYVGDRPEAIDDVVPRFPTNQVTEREPGMWKEKDPPSCSEDLPEGGEFTRASLYCLMPEGSRIYGLEITRSPACQDYFGEWNDALPAEGGSMMGNPVITVQTGRFLPRPIGLLGVPQRGRSVATKLRRYLNQPRISTMPLMWGVVYDD